MTMVMRGCVVTVALLATVACDKMPLTAPTNSTIRLTASASSLALNGSTVISAVVTESGGSAVQNGTTIRFSTTLGAVDPAEAQTTNGIATTTLRAGSVSGVAQVCATSGAGTATGTCTAPAANILVINVGSTAAGGVTVSASPASVPSTGGTTTITAVVTDAAGNRLPGVPVTFSTTAGSLSASNVVTDGSGEVSVRLTTIAAATVTARVSGGGTTGVSGTVTVNVSTPNLLTVSVVPVTASVGSPVTLTVTPTVGANNTPPRIVVAWGDGTTDDIGLAPNTRSLSHTYDRVGTFAITATASVGDEATVASTTVTITPTPSVSISASPTNGPFLTTTFVFTVTPAVAGIQPENVRVEFGDTTFIDLGAVTVATTVTKRYTLAGQFTVRATQTNANGTLSTALVVVTTTP